MVDVRDRATGEERRVPAQEVTSLMARKRRFSEEPFGPTIERLMDETGVTYRGLAAKTGLSAGYLNHLVHGNRPVPSNDVVDAARRGARRRARALPRVPPARDHRAARAAAGDDRPALQAAGGQVSRSRTDGSFFVWLVLTAGINVLALIVINWLFDSVGIEGFWSYSSARSTLTVGNTFIKPVLALLTLPLIIFTLGLAYFALNVAMLALAEWVAPKFVINGFWTYVGATIVVSFVNWVLGMAFARMQGSKSRT